MKVNKLIMIVLLLGVTFLFFLGGIVTVEAECIPDGTQISCHAFDAPESNCNDHNVYTTKHPEGLRCILGDNDNDCYQTKSNAGRYLTCDSDELINDFAKCINQPGCIWQEDELIDNSWKVFSLPFNIASMGMISWEHCGLLYAPGGEKIKVELDKFCKCNGFDEAKMCYVEHAGIYNTYQLREIDGCDLQKGKNTGKTRHAIREVMCTRQNSDEDGFDIYTSSFCSTADENYNEVCVANGLIEFYKENGECKSALVTGIEIDEFTLDAASICMDGAIVLPNELKEEAEENELFAAPASSIKWTTIFLVAVVLIIIGAGARYYKQNPRKFRRRRK
jgi:hypothetical protein